MSDISTTKIAAGIAGVTTCYLSYQFHKYCQKDYLEGQSLPGLLGQTMYWYFRETLGLAPSTNMPLFPQDITKEKILIVAAHPDDEVLGCGGSVAKWSKKGHDVNILIMAEGVTSRDNFRDRTSRKNELNNLETVSKKCSVLLGVKNLKLFTVV